MATITSIDAKSTLLDKKLLQQKIKELNEQMGFVPDPTATAKMAQELMLAQGIRPEDNILSRELLRMRYGESYDPDKDESL